MRGGLVLLAGLMAFLMVSPNVSAGVCSDAQRGAVLVPTWRAEPPTNQVALNGTIVWVSFDLLPGTKYHLRADASEADSVCRLLEKVPEELPCVVLPDLELAFYAGAGGFGDDLLTIHSEPGNEGGTVPAAADYVVVWLRFAPGVDLGSAATEFTFWQGCTRITGP